MADKLKPCPFCGGVAELCVTENGVCVMCKDEDCGAQTPSLLDWNNAFGLDFWRGNNRSPNAVNDAIERWNRRSDNA